MSSFWISAPPPLLCARIFGIARMFVLLQRFCAALSSRLNGLRSKFWMRGLKRRHFSNGVPIPTHLLGPVGLLRSIPIRPSQHPSVAPVQGAVVHRFLVCCASLMSPVTKARCAGSVVASMPLWRLQSRQSSSSTIPQSLHHISHMPCGTEV